jgi:competence protein ComGF
MQKMEWEVFIGQAKKELRISDQITVRNNQVSFTKEGESVSYDKYGSNLRRRVDLKGYEVILQNVKSVTFGEVKRGVSITVIDIYDQSHTTVIRKMIDEESLYVP